MEGERERIRKQGYLWLTLLFLGTSLLWAEDKVCEVNVVTPKTGGSKQWEEARKQHNKFHAAEKDKVAIMVWNISAGSATGNYLTVSCGQTWKDMDGMDAFEQRDEADRQKTITPATGSSQTAYWIYRADLSSAPEPATPGKMMTSVDYILKPSGVAQFTEAVKKINAAIAQTKYPSKPSRWYQLAIGGTGPRFAIVTDRNSWADLQAPDQSMADMLKQAYGNDDKTLQTLRDAIDHTESFMYDYRPDLSYIPSK